MLTLSAVDQAAHLRVESNEYLPLQVTLDGAPGSIDEVFYWRSTSRHSLLEMKLRADSGRLVEIGVVLVPSDRVLDACPFASSVMKREKVGVPCFDLRSWRSCIGGKEIGIDPSLRFEDVDMPFRVFSSPERLALSFDGMVPEFAVRNHGLSAYFDAADRLCGFSVASG